MVLSLLITFLTSVPFFMLFLPFPPILWRRKKTPTYLFEANGDPYSYCGNCGKRREENWIACPFCGKKYDNFL